MTGYLIMDLLCRHLDNHDLSILDEFLIPYTPTSMFLRSNARKVGLTYRENQLYTAHYFGAFENGVLRGVIALNWNGNLFSQVPHPAILQALYAEAARAEADFQIMGILAPDEQAQQILDWLDFRVQESTISSIEKSYTLDIDKLQIPEPLMKEEWLCRLATIEDLPLLVRERIHYSVETFGTDPDTENFLPETREEIRHKIGAAEIFILEVRGVIVSIANYNATLPMVVQIGGVWTPPHFRQKGYAGGVVAGALREAQKRHIKQAVLFTKNPYAMRCYEKLGFEYADDYHLTLFKRGVGFQGFKPVSN